VLVTEQGCELLSDVTDTDELIIVRGPGGLCSST
jgi:hypothetical protein